MKKFEVRNLKYDKKSFNEELSKFRIVNEFSYDVLFRKLMLFIVYVSRLNSKLFYIT